MNRIILAVVFSLFGFQVVAQSEDSNSTITGHSHAKFDKGLGNLIIQTIPSSVMVEIPKMRINGQKFQDSLILEEICCGEYELAFRLKRKRFKCKVDVVENKTIHILVDVKKKTCEANEIVYKPHLPEKPKTKSSFTKSPEVLVIAEEMPQFPGGDLECQKWVARHIRYPVEAQKKGIVGKVFVSFVVNEEGKVVNVKTVKSVHPILDAEGVRVIESMPLWKAGKHKGEFVKVSYTFPINYQLQGGNIRNRIKI